MSTNFKLFNRKLSVFTAVIHDDCRHVRLLAKTAQKHEVTCLHLVVLDKPHKNV